MASEARVCEACGKDFRQVAGIGRVDQSLLQAAERDLCDACVAVIGTLIKKVVSPRVREKK